MVLCELNCPSEPGCYTRVILSGLTMLDVAW